jgi:hypothetical protein
MGEAVVLVREAEGDESVHMSVFALDQHCCPNQTAQETHQ